MDRPLVVTVLLVHRYYSPDTPPYASILACIAEHLADAGRPVRVFSSMPSYRGAEGVGALPVERSPAGVAVRRVRTLPVGVPAVARLIDAATFAARAAIEVLRRRPSVVMVATTPPVVLALAVCLAARVTQSQVVYHCQDIFPEILGRPTTGIRRSLWHLAQRLDRYIMRRADRIVVLSDDMRRSVLERDNSLADTVVVINNFATEDHSSVRRWEARATTGPPRITFAGSINRFQAIDEIVAVLGTGGTRPARWDFYGDGPALGACRRAARRLTNVYFHGRVPAATAAAAIADSDASLISVSAATTRFAHPSKLLTALEVGTPLLVVADPESELSRFVERTGIGVAIAPNGLVGLHEAVERITSSAFLSSFPGGLAVARQEQSAARRLDDWRSLFDGLDGAA